MNPSDIKLINTDDFQEYIAKHFNAPIERIAIISSILSALSPQEYKILGMRNGFYDGKVHTLEEVGKEFGVTRERIRQIEAKTMEKIENKLTNS